MSAVGDTLGAKYHLLRLLGEGGMGQVFEARNLNTGKRVAIKTLHVHWAQKPEAIARFMREARVVTSIEHPNVVDVLDLDVDPQQNAPYIVQAFLDGESLEARLDAQPEGRLSPAEALQVLVPVMSAVMTAHRQGIVHRDLKPANIFLTHDRAGVLVPKVIDFGIAKLLATDAGGHGQTQTGALIGTPAYMSPEQAAGAGDIDARTDVWSLGVVLYEMLTGRLPYEAATQYLIIGKIQYEEPTPIRAFDPTLPPDLVAVIEGALVKDRERRTSSVQAMLARVLECSTWTGATFVDPRSSSLPASNPPSLPAPAPSSLPAPPFNTPEPPPAATPAPPRRLVPPPSPSSIGWSVDTLGGKGRMSLSRVLPWGLAGVVVVACATVAVVLATSSSRTILSPGQTSTDHVALTAPPPIRVPAAPPAQVPRPPGVAPAWPSHQEAPLDRTAPTAHESARGHGRQAPRGPTPPARSASHGGTVVSGAPPPGPVEGLTRLEVSSVLSALQGAARSCANGRSGQVVVTLVIDGDGAVRSAAVSGPFAGSSEGDCIAALVRRAHFRASHAPPINITYPYVFHPTQPRQSSGDLDTEYR